MSEKKIKAKKKPTVAQCDHKITAIAEGMHEDQTIKLTSPQFRFCPMCGQELSRSSLLGVETPPLNQRAE